MGIKTTPVIVMLALLLFSLSVQGTEWYDLEETYSTANFDIYYTDNEADYPSDFIDPGIAAGFGDVLEEVREGEFQYGFDEAPYDYRAFIYNIPPYGRSWGLVSSWDESVGDWVSYQRLDFDTALVSEGPDDSWLRNVAVHEFFHLIQSNYRRLSGWWDVRNWIIEGQATTVSDKIFTINDETKEGFWYNAHFYLLDPKRLMDLVYNAALFWAYVTEQYGTIDTEPGLGMDALVEFWETVESMGTPSNEIEVFDQMLSNLGHPSLTFEDVFKDFVVANYAKDLTGPNVPAKYLYIDETQPPGSYGNVYLRRNANPIDGYVVSGFDFVESWQPRYYRYDRDYQTSNIMEVVVNQITADELFFDLLVVRNDDIIDEIRATGTQFSRTFTGLDPADDIVLVVAGLDNSLTTPAKYIYSISPGGLLSVNILSPPDWTRPANVGPIDNPGKFLSIVEVLDSASPVLGLAAQDFNVRVGTEDAVVISSAFVEGLYFLEIEAPVQQSFNPFGENLEVTVAGETTWVTLGVLYSDLGTTGPATDTIIVIDKSGSMGLYDKIDAAQAAARLYVNSFLEGSQLGLVQFNEAARLLSGLEEVSTSRSTILDLIDAIQAWGTTSIGNGLFIAQNELYVNGDPDARSHVFLLTDGRENTESWISDVWRLLYENNTRLDVVLLGLDAQVQVTTNLQDVARWTGGKAFFAFQPSSGTLASDLASIYRFVAEEIRNEQRVSSTIQQRSGFWTILERVDIDDVDEATIIFNYRSANSLTAGEVTLQPPGVGILAPTFAREKQPLSSPYHYGHFVWNIPNPEIGEYILNITGSGDIEYFFEVGVRGPVTLNTYFNLLPEEHYIGDEIPILISLSDTGPILGAEVIANVSTGTNYINSETWQLHLYDDGAHGDGLSNDGVYGNYFTRTGGFGPTANATIVPYTVITRAVGDSDITGQFTRESIGTFHLTRDPTGDRDDDGLPDVWERRHGLDPSNGDGANGWDGDADLDNLKNFEELMHGTSPTNSDSDRGGESDYSEVQSGRDPYWRDDDTIMPPLIYLLPGNENVTVFLGGFSSHMSLSLYRSQGDETNYNLIASGINPSDGNYTDNGLTNGNIYYYKLVAVGTNGDISGFSAVAFATPKTDTIRPWGIVLINGGDEFTATSNVTLDLVGQSDAVEVRISNTPRFENAEWISFADSIPWNLSGEGLQFVFVQFRDTYGNIGGAPTHTFPPRPADFAADGIVVDPNYSPPRDDVILIDWPIFIIIVGIGIVTAVIVIIYFRKPRTREKG